MEVKEKNKKLLIVVGVLLLFGGVTLAYFVTKAILGGNGGSTSVTTAVINGATLNVEGLLSFEDLDILPGHKTVSSIKVTATGNNELIPYNLIWQGTNTLTTPLNFTIYKTSEEINVTSTCNKKSKQIGASKALLEECTISNLDKLGNEIASGTINKNETKVTLVKDEFITATSTGQTVYYYVILEYPNLDEPQNEDLNGTFEGEVTVEESNIKPDINILAAYVVQDDGTYKQVDDIPQEGYSINQEKSTCSNGATPTGNTPNITINNLNKSGTSCYLYFDKYTIGDYILANVTINEGTPDFSQIADTDEGVYAISDGMQGETSYYWRGDVTDNYVKFANKCWRIVRINGDKSIRLIYDGEICHANGTENVDSIISLGKPYNNSRDRSEYVGWTYTQSKQRPVIGQTITKSNLYNETEKWFEGLSAYADKIADGKFCNDRETGMKTDTVQHTWETTYINGFHYAGYDRSGAKNSTSVSPTLSCSNPTDIYVSKFGAITVDEVILAGGKWDTRNSKYYLYNGEYYWTISPHSNTNGAQVFIVYSDGMIKHNAVTWTTPGVRPVINLTSSTMLKINIGSDGTLDNPYVVAD